VGFWVEGFGYEDLSLRFAVLRLGMRVQVLGFRF